MTWAHQIGISRLHRNFWSIYFYKTPTETESPFSNELMFETFGKASLIHRWEERSGELSLSATCGGVPMSKCYVEMWQYDSTSPIDTRAGG